ncbi:FAD-linked oxidase C-terminal domain-containing protein [Thiomicrorhabdus sp. ZW0627]|uniref:FAD-linked oxidase C-terminal domain-containing protein n=1 Tax=Thiomicrorhabdus sp. ZW0627 TaxID=3039774 RepID=UPI002436D0D2|nr:FAD-linked oxidase C-terminal domain-containing protein [Thiomicrorhabdus sp. ZW0627]MDG6772724.1 FAD-linked oxidase C-terminal domain-containing protein [Thiomicrorhabdus sp. ZW0627]
MSVIQELIQTLPSGSVIADTEQCAPYECDGLSAYRQKPLAVVLPNNIEEVQAALRICKKHKTPVITRGSGTGLAGGALPHSDGIVLGLSKMNRILHIDHLARTAVLQPGVRNISVTQAVEPYGLYYAPDPSSQVACSIGGNVAENSGGVHCLKYGLTVHNVLSITVVNMEGDILVLDEKDDGIDLLALLNGSEGLLGVIVEVKVKLLPKPDTAQLVMAGFDSVTECADAVTSVLERGIIPAGLEMMDKFSIKAAEEYARVGYPLDAEALLLCEVDGSFDQVKVDTQRIAKILEKSGATTIKVSHNEAERIALWQGRKNAFPAVGRFSPDYYCMDGTIPRKRLAYVLEQIEKLSQKYELEVANVFHAGDGNLHPLILYDANKPGELEETEKFGAEILKLCLDVGGTITGEHGVGVEKLDSMCHQFATPELEIFHAIKGVFDDTELMNPGKAVPTLHRCAEVGQMHVHNNQLPFPELERF